MSWLGKSCTSYEDRDALTRGWRKDKEIRFWLIQKDGITVTFGCRMYTNGYVRETSRSLQSKAKRRDRQQQSIKSTLVNIGYTPSTDEYID